VGEPSYPFTPRSSAHLRPGQYWSVPLSDGRFACGRVLGVLPTGADGPGSRRAFVAALMDWVGSAVPTGPAISGAGVVDFGAAHVRTITETGGVVLGQRDLDFAQLQLPERVRPHPPLQVYGGPLGTRPATAADLRALPQLSTWGFRSIVAKAEARFAAP
jgi:hypothetical protein